MIYSLLGSVSSFENYGWAAPRITSISYSAKVCNLVGLTALRWPRVGSERFPQGFSSFSRDYGDILFQTKFLAVGSSP